MACIPPHASPPLHPSRERAGTSCGSRPFALARGYGRSSLNGCLGGRRPGTTIGISRRTTRLGATKKSKQGLTRTIAKTAKKQRLPSQLKRERQAIHPKPSIKGRLSMAKETEVSILEIGGWCADRIRCARHGGVSLPGSVAPIEGACATARGLGGNAPARLDFAKRCQTLRALAKKPV